MNHQIEVCVDVLYVSVSSSFQITKIRIFLKIIFILDDFYIVD